MLDLATVLKVAELLKNLSEREVARQLHLSRGTVHVIATGQHGRQTAARYCAGCGYRTDQPCRVCAARKLRAERRDQRRRPRPLSAPGPVTGPP